MAHQYILKAVDRDVTQSLLLELSYRLVPL